MAVYFAAALTYVAAGHEVCRREVTGVWGIFRPPNNVCVHLAYSMCVYILRVLPTRRCALIYPVIKDPEDFQIFLANQTFCDFWCRKQQVAKKKKVRGDVVEEKMRNETAHFCKRFLQTDTGCRCEPKQRLFAHAGFRADRAQPGRGADGASATQPAQFSSSALLKAHQTSICLVSMRVRLHLRRNISRTPSFCHPFYLLIVVVATAHMLGHARKKKKKKENHT